MMRRRVIAFGFLCIFAVGCAHGTGAGGAFGSDDYRFSIELPGAPFERVAPKDALVALTDPATGTSVAIAASPDTYSGKTGREKALEYIARDLFFFLTEKEYRVFEDATLDGAAAKRITVAGMADDTELVFSAYVALNDGAVYDIVMWCRPDHFETASVTFQKMVDTFKFRPETEK